MNSSLGVENDISVSPVLIRFSPPKFSIFDKQVNIAQDHVAMMSRNMTA